MSDGRGQGVMADVALFQKSRKLYHIILKRTWKFLSKSLRLSPGTPGALVLISFVETGGSLFLSHQKIVPSSGCAIKYTQNIWPIWKFRHITNKFTNIALSLLLSPNDGRKQKLADNESLVMWVWWMFSANYFGPGFPLVVRSRWFPHVDAAAQMVTCFSISAHQDSRFSAQKSCKPASKKSYSPFYKADGVISLSDWTIQKIHI